MRKNILSIIIVMAVVSLFGFHTTSVSAAPSNTNAMTVRFSFTATTQGGITGVTNANSTNLTYKVNKFRFTDKDMLTLLATEFNTTFPDGAELGLTTSLDFVVLDKAGNIFKNVSTNLNDSSYVFNITNNSSPVMAAKIAFTANKTSEVVSEIVPDFTFYYADGKGNNFHFGGLATFRANAVVVGGPTIFKTFSLMISGSGGGQLFNPGDIKYDTVVLTGPWFATGANLAD